MPTKKVVSKSDSPAPKKKTRSVKKAPVAKIAKAPPVRKTRSAAKAGSKLPESLAKVIKALSDKKVEDLLVLNVGEISGYTDYFVIGTGNSSTHVQAMADSVASTLKQPHGKGVHLEGLQTGTWVLADCGDFVVHLFQPAARKFYALEDLWGDAPSVKVE